MQRFGKQSAAAQRAAERRERENSAPRLSEEVPELTALKLEVEERSGAASASAPKYIRRVQVQSAPALFLIPCGDPSCKDGGHDVTHSVMHALRQKRTEFNGTDACHGSLGTASCGRILAYDGFAEYK